jgi:plastocyanin domain-containing protein
MRRPSRGGVLTALAAVAALGAAGAVAQALRAPPAALARARTGAAAPEPDGVDTVALAVERGEYRPNVVRARAGRPLRIRVASRDRSACATRLLVPDLRVDLPLVPGGEAVAVVPAPAPGSYLFTCEARMVKGVIVVE